MSVQMFCCPHSGLNAGESVEFAEDIADMKVASADGDMQRGSDLFVAQPGSDMLEHFLLTFGEAFAYLGDFGLPASNAPLLGRSPKGLSASSTAHRCGDLTGGLVFEQIAQRAGFSHPGKVARIIIS